VFFESLRAAAARPAEKNPEPGAQCADSRSNAVEMKKDRRPGRSGKVAPVASSLLSGPGWGAAF